jgi:hypothetical protein
MKNRTVSIAILALIIVSGCKNDNQEISYYTTYVSTSLATKYVFKPGSYWIYENQNNQVDSVTVTDTTRGFNTIPCPHGCPGGVVSRIEFYQMNLLDVTGNIAFNYYFMGNHIKLNGGGEYGQLGQPVFLYGQPVNYSFNGAKVIDKFDSITISGTKYFKITKMQITASLQYQHEFSYDTYLWFADNFGLIKQEINDTINGYQTWNLKRSHILY